MFKNQFLSGNSSSESRANHNDDNSAGNNSNGSMRRGETSAGKVAKPKGVAQSSSKVYCYDIITRVHVS